MAKIKAIDGDKVILDDDSVHSLAVPSRLRVVITIDGQPANVSDLKNGDEVSLAHQRVSRAGVEPVVQKVVSITVSRK